MFDIILWPFKWIVSAILWAFHELFTAIGMDPASGVTWVLAIIGAIAAVAGIAYAVYRFFTPDYLEDFEDDFDDDFDDYFSEEDQV